VTLAATLLGGLGTYGLGLAVLRLIASDRRGRAPSMTDVAFALGLGTWLLGLIALALAQLGLLRPLPLIVVLAVFAVWALMRGRPARPQLASGRLEVALLSLVVLLMVGNLLRALAPPTAWDALAYHLALAKSFAAAGGFVDLPSIRQARWPLGLDAPFAVAEVLAGYRLSGIVAWLIGLLGTIGAGALGGRLGGRRAGLLAATLFAGVPAVAYLQGIAYLEPGLAGLVALALTAALRHAENGVPGDAWLAGLLAGAAAAVKYTALLVPLLVVLALVIVGRRLRPALYVLVAAFVAAAPWYLRTWSLTGNAIWPYGYGRLGGADWSAEHAAALTALERGYGSTAPADLLRLPLRLTFDPERFDGLDLGPAFLGLLPLALIGADRRRAALLVVGFGGAVAWAATTQQIRFLVPLLPIACATIAAGAVQGRWRWSGRAAVVVAVLVAAIGLVPLAAGLRTRAAVLTGGETVDRFLERYISSYAAMRYVDRELNPRRLLLFREVRGYWLDTPYVWGDPYNQALIDYRRLADGDALHQRLVELSIDAILINGREYPPRTGYYDARTLALMEQMVARHGQLTWFRDGVRVYSLAGERRGRPD